MLQSYNLQEIAELTSGEVVGDPTTVISSFDSILDAKEGDICFLANPKYKDKLPLCKASAVFVALDIEAEGVNLVRVKNPRLAFAELVTAMVKKKEETGQVSADSTIDATAKLGKNVTVYPHVYIGERVVVGDNCIIKPGVYIADDVTIGDDCHLMAHVAVKEKSVVGNRVIINSGSVIGSEGFGYERNGDLHYKVPQAGNVIIEDDVEIGALCAIDCGSIGPTIIGKGTKTDNLVHIAHNVQLGENNLILTQSALAGTVKTGKNVYFAGQSACMDHITIADYAQIGGKSVVTSNIEEAGAYYGYPARPYAEWKRASALFYKSNETRKKIQDLEKRLAELESKEG